MYSVDKLMQTAHEAPEQEAQAPSKRKRRDSGDNKIERHARDGTTKWTKTTCKCGVEKHTPDELKSHIARRHGDGNYLCPYQGCNMTNRYMYRINIWMSTTIGASTAVITKLIKSISSQIICVTNMDMD